MKETDVCMTCKYRTYKDSHFSCKLMNIPMIEDSVVPCEHYNSGPYTLSASANVLSRKYNTDVRIISSSFASMKIKWQKGDDYIDFAIPDFLNDAPSEVIEALIDASYNEVMNHTGTPIVVGKQAYDYLTNLCKDEGKVEAFIRRNKAKVIKRDEKGIVANWNKNERGYSKIFKVIFLPKDATIVTEEDYNMIKYNPFLKELNKGDEDGI